MPDPFPNSVRYVKNGAGGRWWRAAKTKGQIHLGWPHIPPELLLKPDFAQIEPLVRQQFGSRTGATQDFNQLRDLLDAPSGHVWITFEDGYMWWCTARDGATVNPSGESAEQGNFWLTCERAWAKRSLAGKLLAIADLPGTVTTTAGFQGTVCQPRGWETVQRIINGHRDPEATKAAQARAAYALAIQVIIRRLSPKDFEQLIDLILTRSGWARISTLGKSREGIDIEAQNLAAGEIAFVQVKSSANQQALDDYVARFLERRDFYARMIFAVHSPSGTLTLPADIPEVQVWESDRVAEMVVRLGLGEWVESRIA